MCTRKLTSSVFKFLLAAAFIGGATSAFAQTPGQPGDPCLKPIKGPNLVSQIASYFLPDATRSENVGKVSIGANTGSGRTPTTPRPSDDPVIPPTKPGPCPVF